MLYTFRDLARWAKRFLFAEAGRGRGNGGQHRPPGPHILARGQLRPALRAGLKIIDHWGGNEYFVDDHGGVRIRERKDPAAGKPPAGKKRHGLSFGG